MTDQFTRSKLARGTKLLLEHVYTPLSSIASALSNAIIRPTSVRDSDQTFRVNLCVPQLSGSHMFYDATGFANYPTIYEGTRQWAFPIVIPPPQQIFSTAGVIDQNTPVLYLDEVMVSFDQRAEPGVIVAGRSASAEGLITLGVAKAVNLKVSIVEKTMLCMEDTAGFDPDREVFSGELTQARLFEDVFRSNPYAWINLNRQVHPYKTLMAVVDCEGLRRGATDNPDNYLTLPSFTLSLKFRMAPIARDQAVDDIQNMPSEHGGGKTLDSISISTPASDSVIEAGGPNGIDTEATKLDQRLLKRLWGGYTFQGDVSGVDHFLQDAGYEVIAVPMWANNGVSGYVRAFDMDEVANAGAAPSTGICQDERLIPLPYPMTIHHVIGVFNYMGNDRDIAGPGNNGGRKPSSATMNHKIGVGLMHGVRGSSMTFQQIAYLDVLPSTLPNFTVDRIRTNQRQTLTDKTLLTYTHDIVQVPLVQDGGTTGVGYNNLAGAAITQGAPFWTSKGTNAVDQRSTAGNYLNVSGNPATQGAEQYLVARWALEDPNGLSNQGGGAAANYNEVYAGIGGNWLFVVGKKHIAGGREPRMTAGR